MLPDHLSVDFSIFKMAGKKLIYTYTLTPLLPREISFKNQHTEEKSLMLRKVLLFK